MSLMGNVVKRPWLFLQDLDGGSLRLSCECLWPLQSGCQNKLCYFRNAEVIENIAFMIYRM